MLMPSNSDIVCLDPGRKRVAAGLGGGSFPSQGVTFADS